MTCQDISANIVLACKVTPSLQDKGTFTYHRCHEGIFWRSYSDASWEFTREIEEEKLEKDAIYTCFETFLSLEPK